MTLSEDGLNDVTVDVGEAIVAALEFIGELFVIDSEEVEEGGVEIVNVDGVFDGVKADVVGLAVGDAGFHAAASHPDGEGVRVVITAPLLSLIHI